MELQNSYIFLKNPYRKEEKAENHSKNGAIVVALGNNLFHYIKVSFPTITKVDGYGNFYKKKYAADLQFGKITCKVEFIITEVVDTKYLDIIVKGSTKAQIVKCLEHIQYTLLTSGVRERYIDIVSYDAVSEYYCNKIYPKLNMLERNLRKLLFNIYIVNFGRDYYKATVGEDLQGKIKGVINTDSNKAEKDQIKEEYKTNTKKEAEEIERLQRFFYSFEYNDIQKLLFTPSWTNADEAEKAKYLDEHANLTELSDEELREAFSKYVPRSDWERFFSNKIEISDIKDLIEQIRLFRNSVAHFKFFYKAEYDECDKLVNKLNSAIIKAIKITENKDFAEKNAEKLSGVVKGIVEEFAAYTESYVETVKKMQKVAANVIVPRMKGILKSIQESTWLKPLGTFAANTVLAEEARKKQALFEAIKPSTALVQGIIPPYVNETQSLLNSIKMEAVMSTLPGINIPNYNIPKIHMDVPKINLGLDMSSESENVETNGSEDEDNI